MQAAFQSSHARPWASVSRQRGAAVRRCVRPVSTQASRPRQMASFERVDLNRALTIVWVTNALVPGLPLPPPVITVLRWFGNVLGVVEFVKQLLKYGKQKYEWEPFVLAKVDDKVTYICRESLIKACNGPDAESAIASVGCAVYKCLGKECPDTVNLQFLANGIEAVPAMPAGRRGVFNIVIAADTIVLT